MKLVPPVAVIGVCERAARVPDGHPLLQKWNLLGLKSVVPSFVFPLTLRGSSLMFAVAQQDEPASFDMVLRGPDGRQHGTITLNVRAVEPDEPEEAAARDVVQVGPGSWMVDLLAGGATEWFIPGPGVYTIYVRSGGEEVPVGSIAFALATPPPLTPERIAAIKSDPRAAKAVRLELGCSKCPTKLRVCAGLERLGSLETEGYIWYQDLPERFTCSCGQVDVDLGSARSNLHAILGTRTARPNEISFLPMYERGVVDALAVKFKELLATNPAEETLQVFFDQNPLLLHEFSAERTFAKASVLTKYKTDFAILNSRHELVLIELEKTSTRLMTASGGVASQVQHAFDQVHDWLQVFDEHRAAALECLGLRAEDASTVRGVVIAGRDSYPLEHLRRLKARDFGRVRLLTYDDVLNSVINVHRILGEQEIW
jgi:hypothetical protein